MITGATRDEMHDLGGETGWGTEYLGTWGHPRNTMKQGLRPRDVPIRLLAGTTWWTVRLRQAVAGAAATGLVLHDDASLQELADVSKRGVV